MKCSKCNTKMVRNDSFAYTSDPLQYDYTCPKCGEKRIDTAEADYDVEESVSEDLKEAASKYAKSEYDRKNPATLPERCKGCYAPIMYAFKAGAKWQKNHLWKPADGDELPEYEREVVVFTQNFPDDAGMMRVAIGHRPNPDGWDGKSITTGEVEHYAPKTYDKGGWNIPNVKYWLDYLLPNMEKD